MNSRHLKNPCDIKLNVKDKFDFSSKIFLFHEKDLVINLDYVTENTTNTLRKFLITNFIKIVLNVMAESNFTTVTYTVKLKRDFKSYKLSKNPNSIPFYICTRLSTLQIQSSVKGHASARI